MMTQQRRIWKIEPFTYYFGLVIAFAASGFVFCGFRVTQMELAPNFVAAITAANDLVGSLAMSAVHLLFVLSSESDPLFDREKWDCTFGYVIATLILSILPFMYLGSSKTQPWNETNVAPTTENGPAPNAWDASRSGSKNVKTNVLVFYVRSLGQPKTIIIKAFSMQRWWLLLFLTLFCIQNLVFFFMHSIELLTNPPKCVKV